MTTKEKKDDFIKDIIEVYKKHGLSISHEDSHGGFLIKEYSDENARWLNSAHYFHKRKRYTREGKMLYKLDDRFTDDGEIR